MNIEVEDPEQYELRRSERVQRGTGFYLGKRERWDLTMQVSTVAKTGVVIPKTN